MKVIRVNITDEQAEIIQQSAEAMKMEVSDFVRLMIHRGSLTTDFTFPYETMKRGVKKKGKPNEE